MYSFTVLFFLFGLTISLLFYLNLNRVEITFYKNRILIYIILYLMITYLFLSSIFK